MSANFNTAAFEAEKAAITSYEENWVRPRISPLQNPKTNNPKGLLGRPRLGLAQHQRARRCRCTRQQGRRGPQAPRPLAQPLQLLQHRLGQERGLGLVRQRHARLLALRPRRRPRLSACSRVQLSSIPKGCNDDEADDDEKRHQGS